MPLSDLITALDAATGASRELDERIAECLFGWTADRRPGRATTWRHGIGGLQLSVPAYTSSLDAITGAVDRRWAPMRVEIACSRGGASEATIVDGDARCCDGSGPPGDDGSLALCLAAARLAAAEEAR